MVQSGRGYKKRPDNLNIAMQAYFVPPPPQKVERKNDLKTPNPEMVFSKCAFIPLLFLNWMTDIGLATISVSRDAIYFKV